ncbi:MAG: DUF488 domain-containing protein [Bacteroidales bacterium]|uniref:DUF488 domain-containing protein n=1 Tax=Candidatus Cryptobacteroides sp. TaxID=2952915 RepID=UPI002A760024|nr:DUF488 domain-containing protein [Candidatus Cryptobacteroides sp.]MDD7234905.1 DUF488 domain-containing protein [Bacteroidales bacterium]MDY2702229.1 DUF488 domain-containing protein [Candidatus Cryptobacteroides sp.]MDY5780838.1 DUF488 domain-containing protein [Candidatus Cryptobacteroides sp.]
MEDTIYSIGHGNKHFESFVNELKSFDIQYLIDIRSKPYSKWNPDFSQNPLQMNLKKANIVYVYMGDVLGGLPSDRSCYTDNHVDYDKLSQKQFFKDGLNRIVTANSKKIRVAIMCSEADPAMCHRSKLIGQELFKLGIHINHIIAENKSLSQEEVMLMVTGGDGLVDLFGQVRSFNSRKEYAV